MVAASGYTERMNAMSARHGRDATGLSRVLVGSPASKAEVLEAFVWSYIYELLTDTYTLKEWLRAMAW